MEEANEDPKKSPPVVLKLQMIEEEESLHRLRSEKEARQFLKEIGLDWDSLRQGTRDLLFQMFYSFDYLEISAIFYFIDELANKTETFKVFKKYSNSLEYTQDRYNEDIRLVKQILLFSDIGKIGITKPEVYKDEEERVVRSIQIDQMNHLITTIFSISNVPNREKVNLYSFVNQRQEFNIFPFKQKALELLRVYGIDENTTLKQFHDLHSSLSVLALKDDPQISAKIIEGVASHHILDGVSYRQEELVPAFIFAMLIDKYDALMKRGDREENGKVISNEQAVTWIQRKLEENFKAGEEGRWKKFSENEKDIFTQLLSVISNVGKNYPLYNRSKMGPPPAYFLDE